MVKNVLNHIDDQFTLHVDHGITAVHPTFGNIFFCLYNVYIEHFLFANISLLDKRLSSVKNSE